MKVLVACEESGIVREAFKAKGHDAWSCDFLETDIPGQHIQGDVLEVLKDNWDLMIAHPPCTYLTVAGARWFSPIYKDKYPTREQDRDDALEFFLKLDQADIPKICIENPVGFISTRIRKPSQIIQPYHFGHPVSKTTCLWLRGLSLLTPTNQVEPEWVYFGSGKRMSKFHYETSGLKGELRAKIRSRTFQGIADAMAEQWG